MMPDLINGLFELGGGFLIWLSVLKLHRDKVVRGVHWAPVLFFASWSIWNLYFYPSLGQWWSFAAGINVGIANFVWAYQIVRYWGKEK